MLIHIISARRIETKKKRKVRRDDVKNRINFHLKKEKIEYGKFASDKILMELKEL